MEKTIFTVTQFGKALAKSKYQWNEETRAFSSEENHLVLDFSEVDGCTINAGSHCVFKSGKDCSFNTGPGCTFYTKANCEFNTEHWCYFNTEPLCIFNTRDACTFDVGHACTITTGKESVIVRRGGVFEVIQPEPFQTIKLNGDKTLGYEVVESSKKPFSGKTISITIDGQQYEAAIK